MRLVLAAAVAALLLAGCGTASKTVTVGTKTAHGWSVRARDNFLNTCEATAGEKRSRCECEAEKVEAKIPTDPQIQELETNPADKARLVELMISASYACVTG